MAGPHTTTDRRIFAVLGLTREIDAVPLCHGQVRDFFLFGGITMKKIIIALVFLFAGATIFAQTRTDTTKQPKHATSAQKYTCTMHPEVVTDKPGKCPKCGMTLVAVKKKAAKSKKA